MPKKLKLITADNVEQENSSEDKEIKDSDTWRTPLFFFVWACTIWNFDADAAADTFNTLCRVFFEDGLATSWHLFARWVWCNPPYSDLSNWVRKAMEESYMGCGSVLLVPSHKGDLWYRDFVVGKARKVILLTGRFLFMHPTLPITCKQAPFGSTLIVYEPNPERRKIETILEEVSIAEIKRMYSPPPIVQRIISSRKKACN